MSRIPQDTSATCQRVHRWQKLWRSFLLVRFVRVFQCEEMDCVVTTHCRTVRRQDMNRTSTEHSLCAQRHWINVAMVEKRRRRKKILAETSLHADTDQRPNLCTRLLLFLNSETKQTILVWKDGVFCVPELRQTKIPRNYFLWTLTPKKYCPPLQEF